MQPEPLYHVGDLVIINFFDIRLVGNVIAFPRGNFLAHGIIDFDSTGTPGESYVSNYDMLYLDRRYRDQIRTTSDGQMYAYYNLMIIEDYDYIIQLSTGEMVQCAEPWLTPFNRELLTRSINKFRTFRKKKRDDMVSAIALGTKMPLNINRHIASLTLRPLSRKVGGRKKKRKTRKTRKTRK